MATKRKDGDPSKPARSKKAKPTEPWTDDDGWTCHPPSLIYRTQDMEGASKIAAFDFDGTLVNTKSGNSFAMDENDWQLFNSKVPAIIQDTHKKGYSIVIFSNQNSIRSALAGAGATKIKKRLDSVIKLLGVPVSAYIATEKDSFRKPESGMWEFMREHHAKGLEPDEESCYFVGDAAGRPGDFAASDKEFAERLGIGFKTPEECFGPKELSSISVTPDPTAEASENAGLCACFDKLSQLWRRKGDNFKANAFRKVSAALAAHPTKIASGKEAAKLKGVGKASSALIDEYLATGKMQALIDMEAPETVAEAPAGADPGKAQPKSLGLAFL